MSLIENNTLFEKFNASQIKGILLEGLSGTSVFRITKQAELTEQSDNRDIVLQHYLFKKSCFWNHSFLSLIRTIGYWCCN